MLMSARLLADKLGPVVTRCDIPEALILFSALAFAFPDTVFEAGRAYVTEDLSAAVPGCVLITPSDDGEATGCAVIRCHGSLAEIYTRTADVVDLHSRFENQLAEIMERQQDLQGMSDLSSRYLDNQLLVIDRTMHVVAMSQLNIRVEDGNWSYIQEHRRLPDPIVQKLEPLYRKTKKSDADYSMRLLKGIELYDIPNVHADLLDGDEFLGWLVLVANHSDLRGGMLDLLDQLVLPFSHMLKIHHEAHKPDMDFKDYYWSELLSGRLESGALKATLLDEQHWPSDGLFMVSVLSPGNYSMSENEDRQITDAIERAFPDGVMIPGEHQLTVVRHIKEESLVEQTVDTLFGLAEEYQYNIGCSDACHGFGRLSLLMQQAAHALENGLRNENCSGVLFRDIAIDSLLSGDLAGLDWRIFVHPFVWRLNRDDPQNFQKHIVTLRVYLENERQLAAAAKLLYIHKNTLLYRIRKLESESGLSLDQPSERLRILLSLKLVLIQNGD